MQTVSRSPRELIVHLAVKDLQQSRAFFAALGFARERLERHEPLAPDELAACLVVGDDARVVLLVEPCFEALTRRRVCDTRQRTGALHGLSCATRDEVDALYERALGAGGRPCQPPRDHGALYSRSFFDPDGHQWELIWLAPDELAAS